MTVVGIGESSDSHSSGDRGVVVVIVVGIGE